MNVGKCKNEIWHFEGKPNAISSKLILVLGEKSGICGMFSHLPPHLGWTLRVLSSFSNQIWTSSKEGALVIFISLADPCSLFHLSVVTAPDRPAEAMCSMGFMWRHIRTAASQDIHWRLYPVVPACIVKMHINRSLREELKRHVFTMFEGLALNKKDTQSWENLGSFKNDFLTLYKCLLKQASSFLNHEGIEKSVLCTSFGRSIHMLFLCHPSSKFEKIIPTEFFVTQCPLVPKCGTAFSAAIVGPFPHSSPMLDKANNDWKRRVPPIELPCLAQSHPHAPSLHFYLYQHLGRFLIG